MVKKIKSAEKKQKGGLRRGNAPKITVYPKMKIVAEFEHDARDYDLWHTRALAGWNNFKLVCRQRSLKSNFWFSWNGEENRFTSMGDHKTMERHYKPLYDEVVRFVRKSYKYKG